MEPQVMVRWLQAALFTAIVLASAGELACGAPAKVDSPSEVPKCMPWEVRSVSGECLKAEVQKPISPPQEDVAQPVAPTPSTSAPAVAPSSSTPPRDAAAQQQANERLDAAVVNDCFAKLDAIVSEYERLRIPSDDQTLSAASTFSSTLERQCGMKGRVEADPRFQVTLRRLAPLNARWNAIKKRKCQTLEVQMSAAAQELIRGQQALNNSVCYQTCIGNGFEENTCLERCGLGYTRGDKMTAVRDEMKKWSCK